MGGAHKTVNNKNRVRSLGLERSKLLEQKKETHKGQSFLATHTHTPHGLIILSHPGPPKQGNRTYLRPTCPKARGKKREIQTSIIPRSEVPFLTTSRNFPQGDPGVQSFLSVDLPGLLLPVVTNSPEKSILRHCSQAPTRKN